MNDHWRLETDAENIAWLHFDLADSSTNVLSLAALEGLERQLDELLDASPAGLVILSDKPSGFIAGADVGEFGAITERTDLERHIRWVHGIFARLEQAPFPTLALIHGFCLGGGLELALACRYRLAREDADTRLGFPEVHLGIFPGYGGSVRAGSLLGALPALELMLSGRSLSARAARRIGLVDQIAPERQLRAAARELLQSAQPPRRPAWVQRLPALPGLRQITAGILARKVRTAADPRHYPAPHALLRHWRRHAGSPGAMYESEAVQVADLLLGPTARNLIRVFELRERLKAEGKRSDFTPNWVHVVGAGTMGGDIAAWCALQGLRVSLQDQAPESIGQALGRARKLFERRLKDPRLVRAAADRLMPDYRGAGLARADLVIEAVFEDADVKRDLFRQLEERVRPDCLLASNTSTIPLQEIGRDLDDPGRLVGLHFFNPVARMKLVEVVSAAATDTQAAARAAAFACRVRRLPLPVRSAPGFLVNRVLMPYLLGAVQRFQEGVPVAAIDHAAREFGMPMGPLELADRVGLDVCLAAARNLAGAFPVEVPPLLIELVEAGRLGRKGGQGFYRYRDGRPLPGRLPRGYRAKPVLMEQLLQPLLDEATACLQAGIVADADLLDAGLVFGTGFAPFTGGPMHYLRHGGRLQLHRHQVGPATGLGEPMGAAMG